MGSRLRQGCLVQILEKDHQSALLPSVMGHTGLQITMEAHTGLVVSGLVGAAVGKF